MLELLMLEHLLLPIQEAVEAALVWELHLQTMLGAQAVQAS